MLEPISRLCKRDIYIQNQMTGSVIEYFDPQNELMNDTRKS